MKTPVYEYAYKNNVVALCAPAVRMVFLKVGRNEEDNQWWEIVEPVVALQSVSRDVYRYKRTGPSDPQVLPKNHDECLDEGWTYLGNELSQSPLVFDADYGLIESSDELMTDSCNTQTKCIVLPWSNDTEKDAAEFQRWIPEMRDKVDEKIKTELKRKAAKKDWDKGAPA